MTGMATRSRASSPCGAFADALGAEEAGNGVRVTLVYLGRVDTDMQRGVVAHEGV